MFDGEIEEEQVLMTGFFYRSKENWSLCIVKMVTFGVLDIKVKKRLITYLKFDIFKFFSLQVKIFMITSDSVLALFPSCSIVLRCNCWMGVSKQH